MIQKLIKCLAIWCPLAFLDRLARLASYRRPFSFLDRFIKPAPSLSLFGWTETPVDAVNQVGKTFGLALTNNIEAGSGFTKAFIKDYIGEEGSDKPIIRKEARPWK